MNMASENTSFFRNFSALFTGLVVVQIINFLFSLILPKYFSPANFAEFGIFTSVVFILIEVANAKLDIVIMLGKDENESVKILNAAFTVAVLAFFILLLIEFLFLFFVPKIYLLIPFTILLYGIHQPVLVFLNKKEQYSSINLFRIIQVLITCIVTLALAIKNIEHALIWGFMSGLLAATIYVLKFVQPKFDFEATKEIWAQYDQFPKYGTWSSLLNNFSRNSIPILLSGFFSQQMVGFYSYATRLLNAPTGMYTSALGQVYFKKASEQAHPDLKKSTQKVIVFTFLISILPTLFILFFGKELFFSLFSGEWMEAGKIAQYLILWYFLGVIASPVSSLLDIKHKLKFEFGFNAVLFTSRIIAIAIGGYLHDFYLSLLLFSVVGMLMNIYLLYYINYHILKND
ncbi:MAG: oligosaccharide flippase family protein [Chitinophagales bacterium]|nr:oligosaccharide flippase family protein [Chitinophagales bacterium]